MSSWIWVLISLAGILVGAFSEWLKFKEKQAKLGTSTAELEHNLSEQQHALEAAQRRIEHLEAIVTSQMWDALQEDQLALPAEPAELSKEEKVARLAKRRRRS